MDFEDVLKQVGDYGKFQKYLVLLYLMPTGAINVLYDYMFMLSTPDHWCFVPELANLSFKAQQELIRPTTIVQGLPSKDSCHMFDISYDFLVNSTYLPFLNDSQLKIKECDNGWVYDKSVFQETATTKFDLVCEDASYVSTLLSLGAIGNVIVTPILAAVADKIGRRYSFLIVIMIYAISFASPIIFRDFKSFALSRFIGGSLQSIFYQIPFIMVMESVGPDYRTKVSGLSAIAYSIGGCILPGMAYITGSWIWFSVAQLAITIPFFIGFRFLPESASWLLSQGRYEEAFLTLSHMARVNHMEIPSDLMSQIKKVGAKQEQMKECQQNDTVLDLIRVPQLRKQFVILTMIFAANLLAYIGLALNTLNFHGSEFLNYFLLALIDIPALFLGWYLIEGRLGRRWTNTSFLLLCGISLCIPVLIDPKQKLIISILSLMGKFGTAASYMIIYQQSAELYPTTLRSQGMGIGSTVAAAMGIFVPYITYLGRYGLWIPMFLMGSGCLIAGFFSSFLPETLNENLPQNSADSINFSQNKGYFRLARIKPKRSKVLLNPLSE